jgi:hypothetical protein
MACNSRRMTRLAVDWSDDADRALRGFEPAQQETDAAATEHVKRW